MRVQIHELVGLHAIDVQHMTPHCAEAKPLTNEVEGLSIKPDENGLWQIPLEPNEPPFTVEAVELDHTVPTVGWVITEAPRPGKLDADAVVPMLQEQGVHLRELRRLKQGLSIELPNGTVLDPSDYVGPSTQRKIAILSDMRGLKTHGTAAYSALQNPTLLVHEATNACLRYDEPKKTPAGVEASAKRHGHSTPQMAGKFAKRIGAKQLVLTHFSPKFPGGTGNVARAIMYEIQQLAKQFFPGEVITARDLLMLRMGIDGNTTTIKPTRKGGATTYEEVRFDPHRSRQ